jgi:hypothetical protein
MNKLKLGGFEGGLGINSLPFKLYSDTCVLIGNGYQLFDYRI